MLKKQICTQFYTTALGCSDKYNQNTDEINLLCC